MKTVLYTNRVSDKTIANRELGKWLVAIDDFYNSYNQLLSYIEPITSGQNAKAYIGQCSIKQLVGLTNKMKEELKKLSKELDQLKQLKTLTTHTSRLNCLNQQANTTLYLITLSAS